MTNYGLQEWGEVDLSFNTPKQYSKQENVFLKLKDGDNKVRLLTKPSQFWQHKYKPPGDKGFGYRVSCSKAGNAGGSCPLCDIVAKEMRDKVDPKNRMVTKAQKRWLVGVIDRDSASYKILDISKTVFQAVQDLFNDSDWGDPIQYDINIKVNKNGGPTGYYGVTPKNAKPLSEADLQLKDEEMDVDDLIQRCQPPTEEEVIEQMARWDAFSKKRSGKVEPEAQTQTSAKSEPQTSSASSDSDDDYDFPAVDAG